MRPGFASLLTIMTLATPLAGQAAPGRVYWVGFYQALPGKAAAYNKALSDIADPVLDELVRRKQMISHVQLAQYTGAGENSNLVILEFPNWAALDTYEAKLEEASQGAPQTLERSDGRLRRAAATGAPRDLHAGS
jgi:hypothetical protein